MSSEGHRTRRRLRTARLGPLLAVSLAAVVPACGGCSREVDTRPSVVLVVADTLRADAVSAYGEVEGTTPFLDSLAASGLRYTRVFAPSSWTIPSHASLFTGLGVDRHRVGVRGQLSLPEELVTLAERFRDAGYETAAFSENMLVSDVFQLLQGFRYKRVTRFFKQGDGVPLDALWNVDLAVHVPEWLEERPADRPFFLFVNLFDPHSPYTVRDDNPWVAADASPEELRRFAEKPESRLCDAAVTPRDRDILHGLYLGDVAETDRKLARLFDDLERLGGSTRIVSVVTSDHGELFGDRGLLGHEFNLRQGALHVPLVVNGVGAAPAVIDSPVTLADLAASILAWAGLPADPDMEGRPLPLSPDAVPESRPIFSVYSDAFTIDPEEWAGAIRFLDKDRPRAACGERDKVFGSMASIIDWPFKYQWFERYEPELYDLGWDPEERSDQLANRPGIAARQAAGIAGLLDAAWLTSEPDRPVQGIGRDEAEALEALGYAD